MLRYPCGAKVVSLKNIITNILQSHDFEVFEKDGILYGQKDSDQVSVGLFDSVTVSEIKAHAKAVSGNANRNIICILDAGDSAMDEAHRLGLTVWKKSDLEAELGRAMEGHIKDSKGALMADLVKPFEAIEQGPVFIETIGTEGWTQILKSNLTLEDIKEISDQTIKGFKHDLELIPHYVFHYSCTYQGKDGQNIEKSGLVSINALTGKYVEWEGEPEMETNPTHQVQLEPKIDEDNARKIAFHAVSQLNTEFKEVIIEKDHATIIEKAIFKPDANSIILKSQTIVMVPVWCVEGKHGVMILDGVTGKIISEDYYDKH